MKLKSFSNSHGNTQQPLYFAKVDVQSAFDTIPQSSVVKLMESLPHESKYRFFKFLEVKPGEASSKPLRRWRTIAAPSNHSKPINLKSDSEMIAGKRNTIFVDNVFTSLRSRDELLALLSEHVERNMVKIGKKFYRQKNGIPQGSVLSSLLCNYFYADLESKHLSFLHSEESLLLRLVDDTLLITTNKAHAEKFLEIMHRGLPD
jgi:telomerase reverse transcriptase